MLFMTYFELAEGGPSVADALAGAQKIMSKGLFPPKGMTVIRWDTAVDNWGVLIGEADSFETINSGINVWRAALPGFFKTTRTSFASPIQESLPMLGKIAAALSG